MTMNQINKKYEQLKCAKDNVEQAMKKFEGTTKIENYLGYETLKIAHECIVTEMNRFVNRDWN